jgi:hypothetical protein
VGHYLGYYDHVLHLLYVLQSHRLGKVAWQLTCSTDGCSFINGPAAFRIPWALQMIPAILLFFGMMILPESPRWLASKDRWVSLYRWYKRLGSLHF